MFYARKRRSACALITFAILLAFVHPILAHPVAQGSMDVVVSRASVRINARVSMEEVIVSNTQGNAAPPGSTQEAIERHGYYILNHLVLSADDTPLNGRMLSAVEEDSAARDKALYEFVFDLPPKSCPARIKLQQNVLNEFEFSPGNPWEAFYQVRLGMENSGSIEGLLGNKHPVVFGCTWKAEEPNSPQENTAQAHSEPSSFRHAGLIGAVAAGLVVLLLLLIFARRK